MIRVCVCLCQWVRFWDHPHPPTPHLQTEFHETWYKPCSTAGHTTELRCNSPHTALRTPGQANFGGCACASAPYVSILNFYTVTDVGKICRFLRWNLCTRGADKSLARPTSRFILFDGENISFDASLVIYINSTNIPSIIIIDMIYETQNLLSL